MQLLKLNDISLTPQYRIFKESAFMYFFFTLVSAGIIIGLYLGYKAEKLPVYVLVIAGGLIFLFLLLNFRCFKKALARNNWLFAIGPDGVLIKFRSFLNANLPEDDPQVITLPFSKIEASQIIKMKIRYYRMNNNKTTEFKKYLDLHVKVENLQQLKERLKYERTAKTFKQTRFGKTSTKARHYPVSVPENKTIRILWSNVRPRIKNAVNLLARQNISIQSTKTLVRDYTKNAVQENVNPDEKILELAEHGKTIAATRLAQQVYNYDITQARKFVEDLLQ